MDKRTEISLSQMEVLNLWMHEINTDWRWKYNKTINIHVDIPSKLRVKGGIKLIKAMLRLNGYDVERLEFTRKFSSVKIYKR